MKASALFRKLFRRYFLSESMTLTRRFEEISFPPFENSALVDVSEAILGDFALIDRYISEGSLFCYIRDRVVFGLRNHSTISIDGMEPIKWKKFVQDNGSNEFEIKLELSPEILNDLLEKQTAPPFTSGNVVEVQMKVNSRHDEPIDSKPKIFCRPFSSIDELITIFADTIGYGHWNRGCRELSATEKCRIHHHVWVSPKFEFETPHLGERLKVFVKISGSPFSDGDEYDFYFRNELIKLVRDHYIGDCKFSEYE